MLRTVSIRGASEFCDIFNNDALTKADFINALQNWSNAQDDRTQVANVVQFM